MTHTRHQSISNAALTNTPLKAILLILVTLTASACSSTSDSNNKAGQPAINNVESSVQPMSSMQNDNNECLEHALAIGDNAGKTASRAQYLTSARALNSCISKAAKGDQQQTMQMMAVSTLNFIKGGDVQSAARQLAKFKQQYPAQDLYFGDYTSFVDSATALLNMDKLSASELSALNINRKLRAEVERNHYWLSH
jgi:hypothetical protein